MEGHQILDGRAENTSGNKRDSDLPAPVTRATLPCSEADASPRGPGIWSYLLLVPRSDVTPGMVAKVLVVAVLVVASLGSVVPEEGGDWDDVYGR